MIDERALVVYCAKMKTEENVMENYVCNPSGDIYDLLEGATEALSGLEIERQLAQKYEREGKHLMLSSFDTFDDCLDQLCDDGYLRRNRFGLYRRVEPRDLQCPVVTSLRTVGAIGHSR